MVVMLYVLLLFLFIFIVSTPLLVVLAVALEKSQNPIHTKTGSARSVALACPVTALPNAIFCWVCVAQIVWAKCPGSPPWPALVWDPRYLGKDKPSRQVAHHAYSALGKNHLVKFYDSRNSFFAIPYK